MAHSPLGADCALTIMWSGQVTINYTCKKSDTLMIAICESPASWIPHAISLAVVPFAPMWLVDCLCSAEQACVSGPLLSSHHSGP